MGIYFSGNEFDNIYVLGNEIEKWLSRNIEYQPTVDYPGTITFIAEPRLTAFDLRDRNGIVSVQRGVYTFPNTAVTERPVTERRDAPGVWRMEFRTGGAGMYRARFEYTDSLGSGKVAEASFTR